jgi:cytochrome d ubiquinol oxidase subunit I
VAVVYWAFRGMFVSGMVMVLVALIGLYLLLRKRLVRASWFLRLLPLAIFLPYLANSSGWILTEVGRQPWIVFGLLKTQDAVSPGVSSWAMLFSLLAFTLIYDVLMAVDIYLLVRYARKGTAVEEEAPALAGA